MRLAAAPFICLLFLLAGCGGDPIVGCDHPENDLLPFCGFKNPEDLVPMPEYVNVLIVSQFGAIDGSEPGDIMAWDSSNSAYRIMFPSHGGRETLDPEGQAWDHLGGVKWGDPDCPGPPGPDFSPHGIDVTVRPDGETMLLVVNHGGRESIEFLHVIVAGPHSATIWRGCALAPDDSNFNDVVILPDGGFLVTRMMSNTENALWQFLRALFGGNTGWVWEWQRKTGFTKVAGTDGPFPNGIEVSHDGSEIYVNMYAGGEVRRISRATGELLGTAEIASPDNVSWDGAGEKLYVASHTGSSLACAGIETGTCPIGFEIMSVDPETMETERIVGNEGYPMGAATVAVERGHTLFMGTFHGDRVAAFSLLPPEAQNGEPDAGASAATSPDES